MKYPLCLLVIIPLTYCNIYSQCGSFIKDNSAFEIPASVYDLTCRFVDIDNDGDIDAFMGEYYGNIYYYQNTGTLVSPVFTLQTGSSNPFDGVNVGYDSTPTFTDIDNDGDMDAFIGEDYGNIYYYQNTGTSASPVFTLQTGSSNPFDGVDVGIGSIPAFSDIDNDGDMDAFIGEYDGNINYYMNTGSPTSPVFTLQTGSSNPFDGVDVGYYSTSTFADIDSDGDIDAFVGEYDGNINYYKNTGNDSDAVFAIQTGGSDPFDGVIIGGYCSPAFTDIDNDGDIDVFISDWNGYIFYYQNIGNPISPVFGLQTLSAGLFDGVYVGGYSTPAFTDIDADSDMDAFIGDADGVIYYYPNTGSSDSAIFSLQTGGLNPFDTIDVGNNSVPVFTDIDNDGDMDAFIGEFDGIINYYTNTGTSDSAVFLLQTGSTNPFDTIDVGNNSFPAFTDIDNDGDMDAFIGEFDGIINYYMNAGSSISPVFSLQSGSSNPFDTVDVGYNSSPAFTDIDNDGDMDAFIGKFDGYIDYYENIGTSTSPVFSLQSGSINPLDGVYPGLMCAPTFTDIDSDGDMDVFLGEMDGGIFYYLNNCDSNIVSSINNHAEKKNCYIIAYPNPVQNILNIELSNHEELKSILLYNLLGELIYANRSKLEKYQIAIDKFSDGIYILEVKTSTQIFTTKLRIGN